MPRGCNGPNGHVSRPEISHSALSPRTGPPCDMPNIGFIRNTTLDLGHGYLVVLDESCSTDKSNRTKAYGGYALPNHRLRFIFNMTSILHRSLAKTYPNAVGGDGVYLVAANGQKVLDGSSGAAVSCLGHSHQAVINAIIKQAQTLSFAHTSFFTNDPAEQLAALLIDQSGSAFSKVTFFSSGRCFVSQPVIPTDLAS